MLLFDTTFAISSEKVASGDPLPSSCGSCVDVSKTLHEHVLNGTAEKLIAANWIWYEPSCLPGLIDLILVVDAPAKIFPKRHKTVQRLAKFIYPVAIF